MKFVVASLNPDKRRELVALFDRPGMELVSLADVAGARSPAEDGATLEDNARIKARAAIERAGLPAIADDSGLEVDALAGRPGVLSARFAGPNATYADNVRHLLELLADVEPRLRTARFRTVCLALYLDGREAVGEGVLEGRITVAPRGAHGFGYDPVFEVAELGRTLAELDPAAKNDLSHRARAARALLERLDAPAS